MRFNTAIVILPATFATVMAGPFRESYGNFRFMGNCNKYVGALRQTIEDAHSLALVARVGFIDTDSDFSQFMDALENPIRQATIDERLRMITALTSKDTGAIGNKIFSITCDIHSRTKKDSKKCRSGSLMYWTKPGAKSVPTHAGTLTICRSFFKQPTLTNAVEQCNSAGTKDGDIKQYRNRASIFVKQLTELDYVIPGGGGENCITGYPEISHELAVKQPWVAMVNADNYAWMTLSNYLSRKCPRKLNSYAARPKGLRTHVDDPKYPRCNSDGSGLDEEMKKAHVVPEPVVSATTTTLTTTSEQGSEMTPPPTNVVVVTTTGFMGRPITVTLPAVV